MNAASESLVLVRFEPGAGPVAARRLLGELGLDERPNPRCRWHLPDCLTVRARGADASTLAGLEDLPGVERVLTLPAAGRLSRSASAAAAAVELAPGCRFGGGGLSVIAGPCSVESEEQIVRTAELVREGGAKALRGGVFKPRTSPYSFGGLGERGLVLLAKAGERTGLPVVTEALDASQLDLVTQYADMIQIGSRNMSCFPLLFAAGSHPSGCPVLIKRGLAATIDELLEAAEYVLLGRLFAGHTRPGVVLCERGIRTFETSTRFTLDIGAFPVVKGRCGLPLIGDPSHAAGARALVPALARAAVAAGADGLLVEVHPDPARAWCDGPQSLTAAGFRALMRSLDRWVDPEPEPDAEPACVLEVVGAVSGVATEAAR